MNEKNTLKKEGEGVSAQQLLEALGEKLWLIALVSVLCAVLVFTLTFLFVTPQYESAAMFYVNNSAQTVGDSQSITSQDISAAKSLVDSYIVILQSRQTLDEVLERTNTGLTYGKLRGMISASSVNSTEIFRVVVTSPDPKQAQELAAAISTILPSRIAGIIEGSSAKVVESATVPTEPASPNYLLVAVIGLALGLVASIAYVILKLVLDVTIRSEEAVSRITSHPILATVPNMDAPSKGKYYTRERRSGRNQQPMVVTGGQNLLGQDMGFAASEAYKLLRTKLQFSFVDGKTSHVIGLSSAMAGEGKSLTAVNLAYTLSQLDKKVVLLDCDMRRPTLAEKLRIQKKPGLSSCLTGQIPLEQLLQNCGIRGAENAFQVIAAGQNPPNPIELLSSQAMKDTLDTLRANYDYVILDLPPVGEVSDALATANLVDGMLLVVRQDYCTAPALSSTVSQFEFTQCKILGLVLNCASEGHGKYGYYKRKYYGKRYYGYGTERRTNQKPVQKPQQRPAPQPKAAPAQPERPAKPFDLEAGQ